MPESEHIRDVARVVGQPALILGIIYGVYPSLVDLYLKTSPPTQYIFLILLVAFIASTIYSLLVGSWLNLKTRHTVSAHTRTDSASQAEQTRGEMERAQRDFDSWTKN